VRLVNQFGGAEAALDALPALSRRGGRASIRVFTEAEAEAELPPSRPEPVS
jgi:DNA processing protein